MSYTYSQPPGRTRQQGERKPRVKQQWSSEEQDMDTAGASARPSRYSHSSVHRPQRNPQPSTLSTPHVHSSQHEPPQQSAVQFRGSYHVKAPNPAKREAVTKIRQEEEAQYNAYQAEKQMILSNTLSQSPPSKLGGKRLGEDDITAMREKQERETRMAAKFDSIRKREKREQYIAEKKQRENQVYEERKRKAREQADRLEERKQVEGKVQREEMRRARLQYFDKQK